MSVKMQPTLFVVQRLIDKGLKHCKGGIFIF